MRQTLSVAMIAMNEEANLPRTLESVKWADEIILVDSGSRDRTLEIAESYGAKTSHHAFDGHGEQKNVALDLCTQDWILLLDADEELTPELQKEVQRTLAAEPPFTAYWIPRLNLILGRWMRHGGFYPDHKLRLFKRGTARLSEGVGPHSTPQHDEHQWGHKGTLKCDMLHYAYPNLAVYLEHMNRYSSEIAMLLAARNRNSRSLLAFVWNAVLNPVATFFYNYIFRLGFLDGREGLLLHINHSVYIHWKFIKAWWISRGRDQGSEIRGQ
ncbi:glycosyltransferase family 2 protein [Terracidiphilus gabretensis]|jgi:glycosyltransferase involved in cell wall biosynthesis|uniref:glycosyltransferase family 2 protein n=1 Tax=Terracidiphilus gabretensis TaxID=1577687 RepID=UPI00071B6BB1|nr:glycosyltransferase family 2 protein [Terracidiphilus gabretensis]